MYNGLKQGQHLLNKYQKLVLIFPGNKEPIGMVDGFLKFCNEFEYQNEIIHDFDKQIIDEGTLFIIPSDRHLVNVIEQGKIQSYILGENYGVISYNDTVLKKIVGNGISTISTDFYAMGKILAEMILENSKNQVQNHSKLILRNSF
jgi:DNA-binding LacI/PurR family transcriptional regulator